MMRFIQRHICCVLFFTILFLMDIEGLSLYPASDLTVQNFALICDFQGTAWTNTLLFSYDGSPGGGCGSPPNPTCGSAIGVITPGTQTVTLTLNQNEILSKGNSLWTCTHGTVPANYNATVISLCTNVEVKYADEKMDISCSCGFPSVQAELEYKDSQNGDTLRSETFDLSSSPTSNCTTDTRAEDFSSKIANFPSGTVEVCATVRTYSQTTTPTTICELVPGCKYSDAELILGGFSCFLIVFGITSIIMLIFLLCQMLPKIFEDKKANKIIIIVVFNSFALILGFALGFGLKECDKRDLGLGLGLGFGFILAIALFLTLYIYHKQCGSKKENEDENRESPPKFNSKKPEDSPKRVGLKS